MTKTIDDALKLGRLRAMKHRARCAECQGKTGTRITETASGLAIVSLGADDSHDDAVRHALREHDKPKTTH